ncbi:MAG: hypothetical protein VW405_15485 [Rhodospirillaceae bacterium]|jgi:hypothetical protein
MMSFTWTNTDAATWMSDEQLARRIRELESPETTPTSPDELDVLCRELGRRIEC